MVARAKALMGMGILLGAAFTPLAAEASVPLAVLSNVTAAAAPAQTEARESRLTRAHSALNAAIDSQRHGRYEQAAVLFREALAHQTELTADERQDLTNRQKANGAALQARQEGDDQLQKADAAYKAGRTSEAEDLLKKVIANSSVSTDNRRKAMQMAGQIRPRGSDAGTAVSTALPQARAKVQQARAMLKRFDFEGAEQLALEAKKLSAPFTGGEDTPDKVISDVGQLRNDPKALLAGARNACEHGDYDRAEQYAHMAEMKESVWTMHWRGDSPSKVLKDAQAGRARKAQSGAHKPVVAQNQKPVEPTPVPRETVVTPPRADTTAKPNTPPAPMTPSVSQPSTPYAATTPPKSIAPVQTKDDPAALMQQARELMASGNLEEAAKLAYRAKAAQSTRTGWGASWQLFEDTPDKLIKDISKAKHQHDQEESWRVLAEGRKMLDAGDLEAASKCAYKAENMHGPYSIMELGDRPHKLLADVQTAQEKQRKTGLASSTGSKPQETPIAAKTTPPTPGMPLTGTPLPGMVQPAARPGSPGPDVGSPLAQAPAVSKPPPTPPSAPPANDMMKMKAQALLGDARQLQKEGRLIEARHKARECERLNVMFGPEEDRPEQALVQLSALAGKKIDGLVGEADDGMATASGKVDRMGKAEGNLILARQLAAGFGLDTYRIDAKLGLVRQSLAQTKNPLPPPPVAATGYQPGAVGQAVATDAGRPPSVPTGIGSDMLAKARLELRSGHSEVARRLAEEALRGNYGVKAEAEAVLRDINREEYNQSMLAASRTFEAGVQAFNRRDYAQASAIFRTIDVQLLEPAKQGRLKEFMTVPEMGPRNIQQTAAVGAQAGAVPVNGTDPVPAVGGQPPAPSPEATFAAQVQALQDVRFQELRQASIEARKLADDMFKAGDAATALDTLQEYLGRLTLQAGGGQMNPDQSAMLRQPVEAHLKRLKTLKAQQDFEHEQSAGKEAVGHNRGKIELEHQARQKQISELMKRFNDLYMSAKYDDAEVVALQAKDLEPDNSIITAAVTMAHMHRNVATSEAIKKEKAEQWLNQADDSERTGPPVTSDNPQIFPADFKNRTKGRKSVTDILIGAKSRAEQEIERKLTGHVTMSFTDKPLKEVLSDLRTMQGVNIVPEKAALDEGLISLDQPMTMILDDIPLKSALNLILRDAKLTYVVRDDVVQVTTEKNAKGKLVPKVYQVTDLVVPIINANPANQFELKYGRRASEMSKPSGPSTSGLVAPYNPPHGLINGTPVGATNSSSYSTSQGLTTSQQSSEPRVERSNSENTIEDQLISLIKNSIAPTSWNDAGGPATLEYFPLTHALVINQTPDIQEQIQDLLSALRRMQDQEVAIEVRFITVAESFYERIGIDFNINIKTDQNTRRWEPLLTTGQFKPGSQVNDFSPDRFISGLTPAGTFTSDLDIPIKSTSFGLGIPPFGSFPNLAGGNGGLDLGIAFLSDIQVFFFMEAAQGDARTHVMQAPKLTLFNGQTSMITVTDSQFFTADLSVLIIGSQIAFAPTNTLFPTGGVTMFVQAVISADRRFVRLNITPVLNNLASAVVPLIPVVTPIFPATFEGGQVQNPVVFTQFIQQPVFNTITVMTTVAVPDGGTVLMGGLKRMSEGRNEFGPPVLSKIPYINRLFRNVGYGREVESLMLMVTPRIIIQEEEEERATGLLRERLTGQ